MATESEAGERGRPLVTRVEIERLRGIRKGRLDGLAPLTVLVGQNGSGKSTVLDALLIGAGTHGPADLRTVVERRRHITISAPWLVWRQGQHGDVAVTVATHRAERRVAVAMEARSWIHLAEVTWTAAAAEQTIDYRSGTYRGRFPDGSTYLGGESPPPIDGGLSRVVLVEPAIGGELDKLLSRATREGGRRAIEALLREVIDDLISVQMLTDTADKPEVHFEFDWGSVPIALAGDGLHALARLAFMVAAPAGALLLVEEPEVHMHPRALRGAAKAIVESMRLGNQLVISTHSLELIDHMLDVAEERCLLDDVAVFRTLVVDGELRSSRFPGEEARFARQQIEEDLR